MLIRVLLFLAIATLSQIDETIAFVANSKLSTPLSTSSTSASALLAKKKNKGSAGKGFGKVSEPPPRPTSNKSSNQDLFNIDARTAEQQKTSAFTSVEGGLDMIPTQDQTTTSSGNIEDRTGSILREKYGLRTREEQEAAEAKKKKLEDQQKKLNKWKKLADEGEDFDLLRIIPDPILIFIDTFLKGGIAVCTVLFLLAGVAITIEAGSKATKNPLPQQVDAFITNIVEPNFTPGLGVLLSFSIALGIFASLQLNSAASTYREDN